MRRRKSGKLGYLLIGALLILAMGGIIYLVLPEPEPDEHAGQVYLNDGFDMVWITPFENVPVSTLSPNDFRTVDGVPTYTGTDYFTYVGIDTSEHQWEVNWNAAAQYLDFAYVRLGYRGYTEGGLYEDARLQLLFKKRKYLILIGLQDNIYCLFALKIQKYIVLN